MNEKHFYIESLIVANRLMDEVLEGRKDNDGFITFVTNFGYVQGKKYELTEMNLSDPEKISDEIFSAHKKGAVNLFSIANGYYNTRKKSTESEGNKIEENKGAIHLKDVTIQLFDSKNITKMNYLVIFSDQVVGVIPAKMF